MMTTIQMLMMMMMATPPSMITMIDQHLTKLDNLEQTVPKLYSTMTQELITRMTTPQSPH